MLGGAGKVGEIREAVRECLFHQFDSEELERTRKRTGIRWETRLGFTRKGMVEEGWMIKGP